MLKTRAWGTWAKKRTVAEGSRYKNRTLAVDDGFEALLVFDDEGGAHHLQDLLLAEVREEAGNGLSGRADHLGDLLVSEGELDADLSLLFGIVCGPFKEEAREFFSSGMREADRAHFGNGGMIGFAELLRDTESRFAILAKETKKFVASNEIGLSGLNYIGSELIARPGDGGRKPEDLAGFGDAENERLAIGGRSGEFDATAAKDEDTPGGLALDEEGRAFRIGSGGSDGSQGLDRGIGEIAEETLFPMGTGEAVFDNFQAVGSTHTERLRDYPAFDLGHELEAIAITAPTIKHEITCMCDFVPVGGEKSRDLYHS